VLHERGPEGHAADGGHGSLHRGHKSFRAGRLDAERAWRDPRHQTGDHVAPEERRGGLADLLDDFLK
jgi:hypothetical protein